MEQVETKKKVLVVDDEPNVRRLLRAMLSKTFEVFEAEDGRQAIEIVSTQKPNVILMDMMMPRMDGFDCLSYALRIIPLPQKRFRLSWSPLSVLNLILSSVNRWALAGYVTNLFPSESLLDKIAQVLAIPLTFFSF